MRKAIFSLLGFATLSAAASSPDYTKGVFIVNEDWYGHNRSEERRVGKECRL